MKIKDLRMLKKLTQEDLATKLNVERSTVAMWESGSALPRAEKLPEIARVLDCTIDQLYGNEA